MASSAAQQDLSFEDITHPDIYAQNRWHEPFRRLRADGGIHFFEDSRFGPHWAITTHKPIVHVEALPAIYSSEGKYGGITVAGFGDNALQSFEVPMPMFIAMDPPKHTAQRRTVAPSFGLQRMEAVRGRTHQVGQPASAVGRVAGAARRGGQQADDVRSRRLFGRTVPRANACR